MSNDIDTFETVCNDIDTFETVCLLKSNNWTGNCLSFKIKQLDRKWVQAVNFDCSVC